VITTQLLQVLPATQAAFKKYWACQTSSLKFSVEKMLFIMKSYWYLAKKFVFFVIRSWLVGCLVLLLTQCWTFLSPN